MKKTGIWMIALVLLCMLAGCGGKNAVEADVEAITDGLKGAVTIKDEQTTPEITVDQLYGIDAADVVKAKYYTGTSTAEEIVAIEAKDEDTAVRIKEALDKHIQEQKEIYADYAPEELTKLGNPVLVSKGKYVVLCVSDENDKANAEIDKHWK